MTKIQQIVASRASLARTPRGQATAEYALVIIGAATLAGLLIAWAAGTGRIAELLDSVMDSVIGQVG